MKKTPGHWSPKFLWVHPNPLCLRHRERSYLYWVPSSGGEPLTSWIIILPKYFHASAWARSCEQRLFVMLTSLQATENFENWKPLENFRDIMPFSSTFWRYLYIPERKTVLLLLLPPQGDMAYKWSLPFWRGRGRCISNPYEISES